MEKNKIIKKICRQCKTKVDKKEIKYGICKLCQDDNFYRYLEDKQFAKELKETEDQLYYSYWR